MRIIQEALSGVLLIEPHIIIDQRGYFMESFNASLNKLLNGIDFVQDNESLSNKAVARGLHFQNEPFQQAKLVRVITGAVQDVVVDLRKESSTFGKYFAAVLTGENKYQMFVPAGFAHGFVVLEDNTVFSYKCDNVYSKVHDAGIQMIDPHFAVDWVIPPQQWIQSEKDRNLPSFKDWCQNG